MFTSPTTLDTLQLEEGMQFAPKFDNNGLILAIAQDAVTQKVLMAAYMNAEALQKTIETGQVYYYSRSRGCLWLKGETSGQIQHLVDIKVDCDQDALLLGVNVGGDGGCCHTGRANCFYRALVTEKTLKII